MRHILHCSPTDPLARAPPPLALQGYRACLVGPAAERAAAALRLMASGSSSSDSGSEGGIGIQRALPGGTAGGLPAGSLPGGCLPEGSLPVAVKVVPFMVNADTYDARSLQALRQEIQARDVMEGMRRAGRREGPYGVGLS